MMLKRTLPKTEVQEIEIVEKKLRNNVMLSDKQRLFVIEKMKEIEEYEKKKADEMKNSISTMEKGSQTEINLSRKESKSADDRFFWFTSYDDVDEMNEEFERLERKLKNAEKEDRIKDLMDRTFSKRRGRILKERPDIPKVKELFPKLFSFKELKNELARILHSGICETFTTNVKKYCRVIVNESHSSLKESIVMRLNNADSKMDKKIIYQTGSILLLPKLLLSKKSFVVYPNEKNDLFEYPHIVAPSEHAVLSNEKCMKVVAEYVTICDQLTFLDAVLIMMSCFYVFDIVYPQVLSHCFIVMEKMYLEETETAKPPEEVLSLIERLQKSLELGADQNLQKNSQ